MLVTYELTDGVATVAMDDGKVNALSPDMLAELNGALDKAAADGAVVVLAGRDGLFSAGFDLGVMRAGGSAARAMVRSGFELAHRLLSFPTPVVVACTGHAIAMGVFVVLSGDYRVGAAGDFKIVANEVAIGMTLPRAAVEICRDRLSPAVFSRAALLAEPFAPDAAAAAGFLDEVVEPSDVRRVAQERAVTFAALDLTAHAKTKHRARGALLDVVNAEIEKDAAELREVLTGD